MLRSILAAVILIGVAPAAHATIIGGSITGGDALGEGGIFIKLGVPFTESDPDNTVGLDNFQTPNLYGFDEDQNIVIGAELTVDVGTPTRPPA